METKILLKNIEIYGWHGIDEKEKRNGQTFEVDVEIISCNVDLESDDIDKVVNYNNIYKTLIEEFNKIKYNLIESLAYNISNYIINMYKIKSCKVVIRKPNVPIDGKLDYVEVEVNNFG